MIVLLVDMAEHKDWNLLIVPDRAKKDTIVLLVVFRELKIHVLLDIMEIEKV
jgi:hypothetical protein